MAVLDASTSRRAAAAPLAQKARPALRLTSSRTCRLAAVQQQVKEAETSTTSEENGQEIYLGFEKYDTAPRAGRKGKVIKDDPRKYPAKDNMGWFLGVTGGWAGGEAALVKIREEAEAAKSTAAKPKVDVPAEPRVTKLAENGEKIYVGFKKTEIELQKSGAQGAYIIDDARKYPAKENVGPLLGATGGFAGGEKGIKQLVEEGELRLRDPSRPASKGQSSPISLLVLVAAGAGGGGILLNGLFDAGEGVVKSEIVSAPVDEKTKALLLAAVALLASAGLIGGARAAMSSLGDKMKDGASNLVALAGFFVVLFVAARAVLEL